MSNPYFFLKTYRNIAKQTATQDDIEKLYYDLMFRLPEGDSLHDWFDDTRPSLVKQSIAIDAVAHQIHENGDSTLQEIYPGAKWDIFKENLDSLTGLEKDNEVRRANRGYYSPVVNESKMTFLRKSIDLEDIPQVGRTTQEDISEAIKAYENLDKADLASPAELLTLARYHGPDSKYHRKCEIKGFFEGEFDPLVVGGPASVEMVDSEGHLITSEALSEAFSRFMENIRLQNIQLFHSDVQIGWPLKAYISPTGEVFKSGVDDKGLWLISELRDDISIAKRTADEIHKGNIQSYSIAGNATETKHVTKGVQTFMQVDKMDLVEVTLCEKGVNQGAFFNILKSEDAATKSCADGSCIPVFKEKLPSFSSIDTHEWGAVITEDRSRVIICADRSNSITDALSLELRKFVSDEIPIVVEPGPYFNCMPLLKADFTTVEKPKTEEEEIEAQDIDTSIMEDIERRIESISDDELEPNEQINCYGYHTENFDICPKSVEAFSKLCQFDDEEIQSKVIEAVKITDEFLGLEKVILEEDFASEDDVENMSKLINDSHHLIGEISILTGEENLEDDFDYSINHFMNVLDKYSSSSEESPDIANENLALLEESNYRPSEKEAVECHTCEYFADGGWCTKLHQIVDPEYVCDYFNAMPGASVAEEWAEVSRQDYELEELFAKKGDFMDSSLEYLNEWLEKSDDDIWDVSDGEKERHDIMKQFYSDILMIVDEDGNPVDET